MVAREDKLKTKIASDSCYLLLLLLNLGTTKERELGEGESD